MSTHLLSDRFYKQIYVLDRILYRDVCILVLIFNPKCRIKYQN